MGIFSCPKCHLEIKFSDIALKRDICVKNKCPLNHKKTLNKIAELANKLPEDFLNPKYAKLEIHKSTRASQQHNSKSNQYPYAGYENYND